MSTYIEPGSFSWPQGLECTALHNTKFPHRKINFNMANQTFGFVHTDNEATQTWALGAFDSGCVPVIRDSKNITADLAEREFNLLERAAGLYRLGDVMGENATVSFMQIVRHEITDGSQEQWDQYAVIASTNPQLVFHDRTYQRIRNTAVASVTHHIGALAAGTIRLENGDFMLMASTGDMQKLNPTTISVSSIHEAAQSLLPPDTQLTSTPSLVVGVKIL